MPSPPPLRRADQRIIAVNVKALGDPLTLPAVMFDDVVEMEPPYVIVPAGDHVDVYIVDIGHAVVLPDRRVHLDNTLQPPPMTDASRTLLVVSGAAAYVAMGVSSIRAHRAGIEHPSVCVLPDAATDSDIRTVIAIHVLALYKRLHSA